MKVFSLNTVCGTGSTGRIAADIARLLARRGHSCKIGYGRGTAPGDIDGYRVGTDLDMRLHGVYTRLTDRHGFASAAATRRLIQVIEEYAPDLIHLHNIHGYYLHIPTLFDWLAAAGCPVVWTLHDCWAFTGHCSHYDLVNCNRWQTGCHDCPQKKEYPASLFRDASSRNYRDKQRYFNQVKEMTLVTPSDWLADEAGKSFLKSYPVRVIRNGIDLEAFCPRETGGVADRLSLRGKRIILGVANVWNRRKGLEDFAALARLLDETWKIVLVGLTEGQVKNLPEGIMGLTRTESLAELAELYSLAEVFVNPTQEDNFPTTNLEALACGTPVITYPSGGSPEGIDETCGAVTCSKNPAAILEILNRDRTGWTKENCQTRARQFDRWPNYARYLELYTEIIS